MRPLFLVALAAFAAFPVAAQQTKVLPDCVIDFSFTAGGQTQGGAGTCGNNTAGVVQWTVWYKSTGFSALSLRVESASDSSGSPGSWGAFAGTVVSGVNPNTDTGQNQTMFKDFEPWVRVALNSATGSGRVTGQLYGCRQPGCSGGLAISVPPSGAAGGDLCGTYPDPTVCKVDGVAYPAGPSTNTVPVVTAPNTVTYEKVPNAALANSSTTVNGTPCTLGSACSPTAVPSGACGGDLGGTFPNCDVDKVHAVAYPAGPSTNTVPVVTGTNAVTYEAVPNAALANSSTTVNGTPCTLGSACSPTAVPSGACGGDLGGTFPNCDVDKVHAVAYPAGPSTNTVPVVTGTNAVTYEAVPNAALANSSMTISGTPCTLGSSCSPAASLNGTNLTASCSGTAYTLTASLAAVTCGTTSPTITISTAGTYLLLWNARVDHNAATYAANRTVTVTLARTNNTPATISGSGQALITNIITTTTETAEGGNLSAFVQYTTANTNDIIVLEASVSVVPTAGTSSVSTAKMLALRLF